MVYVNPVEEDWADGSRYDQLGTPFYLSPDKLQSDYNPVRFSREIRLFRRFVPQGRILDVGCSTGAFLFHLQARFPGEYDGTGGPRSSKPTSAPPRWMPSPSGPWPNT
jgi:SAM-dependent methyltransferase